MKENTQYEMMENYLQGLLSVEEADGFETKLAENQALRDEFDLYKQIRMARSNTALTDFEKKLATIENSLDGNKHTHGNRPGNSKTSIYLFFLFVALGIAGTYFLKQKSVTKSVKEPEREIQQPVRFAELYNRFAQHDFSFQEMSNEGKLSEIQSDLESGQFEIVLPKIDAYLDNHPNAAAIKMAKGIVFLETGDKEAALRAFLKLKEEHSVYKNEANRYIALTYLKHEDSVSAISFLELIPENSSRYSEAVELKKALK